MFKKKSGAIPSDIIEGPEWEEVEGQITEEQQGPAVESVDYEGEPVSAMHFSEFISDNSGAHCNDVAGSVSAGSIEFDGNVFNLNDFPALRMVHGTGVESAEQTNDTPSEKVGTDAEYDMSELIMRYAAVEDSEENGQESAEEAVNDSGEELPSLFRLEYRQVTDGFTRETSDAQQEDFTMESELETQREISGELFEYIDTIRQNAVKVIREKSRKTDVSDMAKCYDPYNLSFNNQYDDTDEVLSNTPEIPMNPKYKLES